MGDSEFVFEGEEVESGLGGEAPARAPLSEGERAFLDREDEKVAEAFLEWAGRSEKDPHDAEASLDELRLGHASAEVHLPPGSLHVRVRFRGQLHVNVHGLVF